jgi:hypothetical protein
MVQAARFRAAGRGVLCAHPSRKRACLAAGSAPTLPPGRWPYQFKSTVPPAALPGRRKLFRMELVQCALWWICMARRGPPASHEVGHTVCGCCRLCSLRVPLGGRRICLLAAVTVEPAALRGQAVQGANAATDAVPHLQQPAAVFLHYPPKTCVCPRCCPRRDGDCGSPANPSHTGRGWRAAAGSPTLRRNAAPAANCLRFRRTRTLQIATRADGRLHVRAPRGVRPHQRVTELGGARAATFGGGAGLGGSVGGQCQARHCAARCCVRCTTHSRASTTGACGERFFDTAAYSSCNAILAPQRHNCATKHGACSVGARLVRGTIWRKDARGT